MEFIKGARYKVIGTSDYPICDCCGKTNLTRAVRLQSDHGDDFNVGVICASKLLSQSYMGKTYPASSAAVMSMGKHANKGEVTYLVAK